MSAYSETAEVCLAPLGQYVGDKMVLIPRMRASDPNAVDVLDPSRNTTNFMGTPVDSVVKPLLPNAYDPRADFRPGQMATKPQIEIMPDEAEGMRVEEGDLVFVKRTGITWRVSSVEPDEAGILVLNVNLSG
jgi:hypothetical protein